MVIWYISNCTLLFSTTAVLTNMNLPMASHCTYCRIRYVNIVFVIITILVTSVVAVIRLVNISVMSLFTE